MKKGFTLIEIMGVIILLGLISVIVVPVVDKVLRESRSKILNEQLNNIYIGAKNWGIKNVDKIPNNNQERVLVRISTLKEEGFLENKEIKNPVNQQELKGCVEIIYDESFKQYDYNYDENCITDFTTMTY